MSVQLNCVTSVSSQLFQLLLSIFLHFGTNLNLFNAQFKKMLSKIVKLSIQGSRTRLNGYSTKSQVVSGWRKYKKSLIFGGAVGSLLFYDFAVRECETIGELMMSWMFLGCLDQNLGCNCCKFVLSC